MKDEIYAWHFSDGTLRFEYDGAENPRRASYCKLKGDIKPR